MAGPDRHRRRQGPAVGGLRRARGARARPAGGHRAGQAGGAGLHARPRRADRASAGQPGAAAAAADPRRGAPLRRDLPPQGAQRCATCGRSSTPSPGIGPRRRKPLLTRFGSVAGVRRATREELDGRRSAPRRPTPVLAALRARGAVRRPERPVVAEAEGRTVRTVASDTLGRLCTAVEDRLHRPRRSSWRAAVLLTVHEAAHAWTAVRLGDPTARHAGPDVAQPAGARRPDRHHPAAAASRW